MHVSEILHVGTEGKVEWGVYIYEEHNSQQEIMTVQER